MCRGFALISYVFYLLALPTMTPPPALRRPSRSPSPPPRRRASPTVADAPTAPVPPPVASVRRPGDGDAPPIHVGGPSSGLVMGSDTARPRRLFSHRLLSARPVADAPAPASGPDRRVDSVWSLFGVEGDSDDAGDGDVGGGVDRDRDRDRRNLDESIVC